MSARLALAALLASACYDPKIGDCSILCGTDSSCPSGLTCGGDGWCHSDPNENCVNVINDARLPDAPKGQPDVRNQPDAPSCNGGSIGEPDNSCPGESTFPIVEGTHQTFDDRRIFPGGDVDIFTANLALLPHPECHTSLSYALQVKLSPPSNTNLVLRRVNTENRACSASSTAGTSLCIPFTVACTTATAPTFVFQVGGNGNASSCSPYTLDIRFCAAGSTCDSCK